VFLLLRLLLIPVKVLALCLIVQARLNACA
jgi:hypothetical protein